MRRADRTSEGSSTAPWLIAGLVLLVTTPAIYWLSMLAISAIAPSAEIGGYLPAFLLTGLAMLGSVVCLITAAIMHFSGELRS